MRVFLVGAVAAFGVMLIVFAGAMAFLGGDQPDQPQIVTQDTNQAVPQNEPSVQEPPQTVVEAPQATEVEPAPTPEPAAEPVPARAPLTLAALAERRAKALADQQKVIEASQQAEADRYQQLVDHALLDDADAYFDDATQAIAAGHRTACAAGGMDDCVSLAEMYQNGMGTWPDLPLATAFYFTTCTNGSDAGCLNFSYLDMLETYDYAGSHPHVAHFQMRCDADDAVSCRRLAQLTKYGSHGVAQQPDNGDALYQKACALGDASSCQSAGNTEAAMRLYQAACDNGDGSACYSLAQLRERDGANDQAIALMVQACDLDNARACRALGQRYEGGDGLAADPVKALAFYDKGCALGAVSACHRAGLQYEAGTGTPIDLAKANARFSAACAAKYPVDGACNAAIRVRTAQIDHMSPDVDVPLASNPVAATARQACLADDSTACVQLAELHRAEMTPEGRVVASGLFGHACSLGVMEGCIEQLKTLRGEEALSLARTLCDAGVSAGCVRLAELGAGPDGPERLQILIDSCDAGGAAACTRLGSVYLRGGRYFAADVPKDVDAGYALFERACEAGDGSACGSQAMAFRPDVEKGAWGSVDPDPAKAIALLEKGCALGGRGVCNQLAYSLEEFGPKPVDAAKVAEARRRACVMENDCEPMLRANLIADRDALRAEHGDLQSALLDRYDDFAPHYHARVRRAKQRCLADKTADCIQLGAYYYDEYATSEAWGLILQASDRTWARALYLHACDLGDAQGCAAYASAHDGIGEETEPDVVLAYYKRGCDMGDGRSCTEVGTDYNNGFDVTEDHVIAGEYLTRACDLGDNYGCQSLSGLFDIEDEGLRQDYTIRACLNGRGLACEFAGLDYHRGRDGVPQDKAIGEALLGYGCMDGDEDICALLERVKGQ